MSRLLVVPRRAAARAAAWSAVIVLSCAAALPAADQWPRFRGPSGQGLSDARGLPVSWSRTANVAWETPMPGAGWSSPVVWHDHVFVTTATDDGRSCRLLALDRRSGRILWDRVVLEQQPGRKEGRNSYATPTPATDGERVYVACGDGSFAAVGFDGRVRWTHRGAPFHGRHGLAASLLVHGDLLITARDGSSDGPDETVGWQKPWAGGFVLALETRSGRERWRTPRGLSRIGHATPIVIDGPSGPRIVSPAGDVIQLLDPRSGRLLASIASPGEGVVPSPITADGLVVTASGFGAPAIRAVHVATGTVAWEQTSGVPMQASPIYVAPYVYAITDQGILTALEGASGKVAWRGRLEGAFSASPVHADGRLYFLSEACETFVIAPGASLQVLARNALEGHCQASIAVAGRQLLIRTSTSLYAIEAPRG